MMYHLIRSTTLILAAAAVTVNAHFQLQFPLPRGVFVQDNEPTFCDGYTTTTTNRTQFPLTGGFFSLNSEHPTWTVAINATTSANPTTFADFSLPVVPFFQLNGEGLFCVPMDFSSSFQAGENVTIQVLFNGGDGNLYQCADLTLSSASGLLNGVSCSNATTSSSGSSTASAPASTSATTKSSASGSALWLQNVRGLEAVMLGLALLGGFFVAF